MFYHGNVIPIKSLQIYFFQKVVKFLFVSIKMLSLPTDFSFKSGQMHFDQ